MSRLQWLEHKTSELEILNRGKEILGAVIHPLAIDHLLEGPIESQLAFPRLESHGGYLFGTFFLPSNVRNPSADYDSIVFVANHDSVIATTGVHPSSTRDWLRDKDLMFEVDTTDSTPDGGQFILNMLRLAIKDLTVDASSIRDYLLRQSDVLTGDLDLRRNFGDVAHTVILPNKKRRELLRLLSEVLPTTSAIVAQLPVMVRVATETSEIIRSLIANDERRDLQQDLGGNRRELFSNYLEIFMTDLYLDSRQLVAVLDDVQNLSSSISMRARQLREEENVAAGRFTGAIASIMLLPTFIVGLYGQNFAEMPETDWRYGYLFSWGTILILTTFQVMFFRRRRWI